MEPRVLDTIELHAPAISCAHCQATIENGLRAAPGVDRVDVEVGTKAVRITYDRAVTDADALRRALAAVGYAPA